jgi:NADH-quinone oxidoreductase subunit L
MLVGGALLTAFYMTRQVSYVFFGNLRGQDHAHESPAVMLLPLAVLALCTVFLGFVGTPAWPWFHAFLQNREAQVNVPLLLEPGLMTLMGTSTAVVLFGLFLGWRIYGNKKIKASDPDPIEKSMPWIWAVLHNKFYIDELYGVTFIAFYAGWARFADWLDRRVWGGIVEGVSRLFRGGAQLSRLLDVHWVNGGFDKSCEELANGGGLMASVQSGRVQMYLRLLALAVVLMAAILIWSTRG